MRGDRGGEKNSLHPGSKGASEITSLSGLVLQPGDEEGGADWARKERNLQKKGEVDAHHRLLRFLLYRACPPGPQTRKIKKTSRDGKAHCQITGLRSRALSGLPSRKGRIKFEKGKAILHQKLTLKSCGLPGLTADRGRFGFHATSLTASGVPRMQNVRR